jgi:hypothetical protein
MNGSSTNYGLTKVLKKFLHERKQAKLQWLQDPSQINAHNVNNISVKQVKISGTEGISDRQKSLSFTQTGSTKILATCILA